MKLNKFNKLNELDDINELSEIIKLNELNKQNEINKLVDSGRSDLAESIIHVSVVEGDGAGYDIRSFNNDGSVTHIEVKATKGSIRTPFFISANELAFARAHPASFRLVRVFDFDAKTMTGNFYEVCGDVSTELNLEPISYKVRV